MVEHDAAVTVLSSDSFFVGAHVLMLDQHVQPLPARGVLVSVPNRHTIFLHPILDARVVFAINHMIVRGNELYRSGPGAASPSLYGWRGGENFMLLPLAQDQDGARFSPPQEFIDQVLEPLRPKS